jgi:histone chaperone ASF1
MFLFLCLRRIVSLDLEWSVTYVGSASSEKLDQILDCVSIGPVAAGLNSFVFEVPSPNTDKIPKDEWLGLSVILVECTYREKLFFRIGYYVENEYTGGELEEAPESIANRLEQQKMCDDGEDSSEDEDDEDSSEDDNDELSTDDLIDEDEDEKNTETPNPGSTETTVASEESLVGKTEEPPSKKRPRESNDITEPGAPSSDAGDENEGANTNHKKKAKYVETASSNDGGDEAELDFMIPLRETAPRWFSNVDPNLITRKIIMESHRITLFNIRWDEVERSSYDYDF